MKMVTWRRVAMCGVVGFCVGANADLLTFAPTTAGSYHDSFIGTDGSAVGSGAVIGYIGAGYSGSYQYEYIVQFDQLSSWIGGFDKVTNATLQMQFYYPPANTDPVTPPSLDVYRLTNSWVNGATWTSRGGALGNWVTPGGDFDPTPVASLSFPTAPAGYSILSWDVTGLVSNWVAGVQPHDGFLIKWNPSTSSDFIRFWYFAGSGGPPYSGSFVAPTLTFSTIPEPSAMALVGLSAWGILVGRRFSRH